jgi:hypothetical protein
MKQIKQTYVTPKVEFVEMETQGVLCSSADTAGFGADVMEILRTGDGAWVIG